MTTRARVKAIGFGLLARGGPAWVGRALRRKGSVILSYHNILPDGAPAAGERSLHLPQREFARQLDALGRTHRIVSLAELLDGPDAGPGATRPRAAITFDDGYRGALTAGVAELERRSLPATIFITPHFLGGRSFWWDVLADPATGTMTERVRNHALTALSGRDAKVREWATQNGMPMNPMPEDCCAGSVAEVKAAIRGARLTIGSHSWSHANLSALDGLSLREEVERPLPWLRQTFGDVLPAITYPYGLSSRAVERATESAGYRAGLLVAGGWMGMSVNRFAMPRVDVAAGLPHDGFVARVAGLI